MKIRLGLVLVFGTAVLFPPLLAAPRKPTPVPTSPPAEAGQIEGITIPRGDKFLGIALVNSTFKLTFYDAEKAPIDPDVKRAALRWPVVYRLLDERALLTLAPDGKSLTSSKAVKPPYYFKLYITLLADEGSEEKGESFVVDFKPSGIAIPSPTPAPSP